MVIIIIKNLESTIQYQYRDLLEYMGFSYKRINKYSRIWYMRCDNQIDLERCKNFCKFHRIDIEIYNDENYSRAFRKKYFIKDSGFFNKGKYYHCACCGMLLKKDKVWIDHLFPVYPVKENEYSVVNKRLLKFLHMTNIDCNKNLISLCKACYINKGCKTGIWIIRGWLGKHFIFWILFYGLILAYLVILCMLANIL